MTRGNILFVVALLLAWAAWSPAASGSSPELEKAIESYWNGEFEEAIQELNHLAATLEGEDRIRAWEFLARSHVRVESDREARDVFKELLRLEPTWRPDPKLVAGPEWETFEAALAEYENEHLGSLNVRTTPKRADVYIDGDLHEAPTPVTIERVPAGEHQIRLELEGYVPFDTTVTVVGGEIALLERELEEGEDGTPAPFWRRRWVQVTGGVLGAGILIALVSGDDDGGGTGDEGERLADFPNPPHE